jgi:predicted Zn-dependent protease
LESIDESQKKHVVQKTNPEDAQDIMAEQSPKTWVLKEELEKLEKIINHEEITDEKLQRLLSNLIRNNHNISDEDNQEYLERLTILNNRKNVQKS